MMSCLDLGSRLGRNAPHLTEDPVVRDFVQRAPLQEPRKEAAEVSACYPNR